MPIRNPGEMRHAINLQQRSSTLDSFGQPATTYTTVHRLRAAMDTRSGTEFFSADHDVARHTVRFRTRYVAGLDESYSLLHGTDRYNITSLINLDGRNEELHIIAERVI